MSDFIKILRVIGAFGIKGAVRVFLFTDQLKIYSKVFDKNGNCFSLNIKKLEPGNKAIIFLDGVSDRNIAESLKGAFFYIKRDQLPQIEDNEFYLYDLIGEKIYVENMEAVCKIKSVQNYGAGDLIELTYEKMSFLVPFTQENFPDMGTTNKPEKIYISEEAFCNFFASSYKN